MKYPGKKTPDAFMAGIVTALNDEVLRGDVYPLMATYSEDTCDRKYLEGCDYVCVNIKKDEEIFVVDIYPHDSNNVVLALFRRKDLSHGSKSLYKREGKAGERRRYGLGERSAWTAKDTAQPH